MILPTVTENAIKVECFMFLPRIQGEEKWLKIILLSLYIIIIIYNYHYILLLYYYHVY